MKILQLVTRRQYRGAEVFAANLSSELISLGHDIIFAGLYKNDKDVLSVENAQNLDLAQSKEGMFSFSLLSQLVKLIRRMRPDVIQCNGSDTLKYMVAASYFAPKVPIIYRNISMISEWVSNGQKRFLYKRIFRRVDHVSSVGEEAVADFISTFGYPSSRISVIRRGIPIKEIKDSKLISEYRRSFGIEEEDKVAIHIGNFSPEKNHDLLLDLFYQIKQENPKIKLICVGTGIRFGEIKEKLVDKDLDDTVILLGFRKDIPELLAASDCFVLSSFVEGVPGVILEAGAQKKPAVATNVGGVSEVLVDQETGYLIDNFDRSEFKEKLLKLLLNEDLREKMGENAYRLVYDNYNPVKNAAKFEYLYQKLIKEKTT